VPEEAIMVAMRWLRICLVSFVSVLALAACIPANASGATVLIVSPGSIRAGFQIEVNATCSDMLNPAYVTSPAFGSITLEPDHGLLMADVTVPSDTPSGTYTVSLNCASGGHSSAKLTVLDGSHPNPHHGPETGGGEMGSTTGAHLALLGGLGTLLAGAGIVLVAELRRRASVRS
jgi:hypothetical protein